MFTGNSTIFHLHWLREGASGVLDADLGAAIPSGELELAIMNLLPHQQSGAPWTFVSLEQATAWVRSPDSISNFPYWIWRKLTHYFTREPRIEWLHAVCALAGHIRAAAAEADLHDADLYLPYFDRRDWNHRWELFPAITFVPAFWPGLRPALLGQMPGGKPIAPFSLYEYAHRAAACSLLKSISSTGPVFFEWTGGPLTSPWNRGLIEHYKLDVPAGAPGITKFQFLQPDAEVLKTWFHAPRERQMNYYSTFSRMSLSLQVALRRWVLAAFAASRLNAFADFDQGAEILVYAATKPYTEKRSSDYSYDVLNPRLMEAAFSRARHRLEPLLQIAERTLNDAGLRGEAYLYVRKDLEWNAMKIIQRARRRPRVRAMLVAESTIIYALIRFAARVKLLSGPREINRLIGNLVKDLEERTRKLFYFLPDHGMNFPAMLFLEAVHAMHFELTKEAAFEVRAETEGGMVYRYSGPFSDSVGLF